MTPAERARALAPRFNVIEIWPHETECVLCGTFLYLKDSYGLPMYEGHVVPDDWPGQWAGFPACEPCYRRHRP